ncbi:sensor histidine kinase [Marilutibacter chinensis]|uniref:sensor histidine kinase n=1 Tax=Marilutibacter chinensis TaxID=2912247 RepID=UPI001F16E2B9|nr:ATP-binding protein [Lysobacter chinensis]
MLSRLPGDDALRLVMAASGIGMALADLDGRMQEVNPALCRMLGYDESWLVGRPYLEIVHPDEVEVCIEFVRELMRRPDDMLDQRRRYVCGDGSVLHAHINVALLRDHDGQPLGLLAQIRDIGDELAREASLRARVEHHGAELEVSHRQLQLFADAVTHDLRAPLRAIESFSERLARNLEDRLDDASRDHLERIRSAATRMSDLLSALGRLSQATRAELRIRPVDLSLLADWACAERQDADPARTVQVRIQPGLGIEGDERLLKMMLDEVINNAWKFTRDRSRPLIEIEGGIVDTDEGPRLQLRVRDNGCGFDMRYAHKLYEPFQRLHGPDQGGGHGLGLAIAHRIARRHGGRVRAESTPEVGSTITIELPVRAAGVSMASSGGAPGTTEPAHGETY